jgi:YggT family protein
LTEPVLRPFRKVIPPIAGLDLSPLFALIAIRFLLLLIGW